jgi:hypothetical protein
VVCAAAVEMGGGGVVQQGGQWAAAVEMGGAVGRCSREGSGRLAAANDCRAADVGRYQSAQKVSAAASAAEVVNKRCFNAKLVCGHSVAKKRLQSKDSNRPSGNYAR